MAVLLELQFKSICDGHTALMDECQILTVRQNDVGRGALRDPWGLPTGPEPFAMPDTELVAAIETKW